MIKESVGGISINLIMNFDNVEHEMMGGFSRGGTRIAGGNVNLWES
jgi:hypothetical protein